jgi:hypothetical protein
LGLTGFAVAIIAGLAAGNTPMRILWVAIVSMLVCQLVGLGMGWVLARVGREHVERYRQANPVPVIDRAGDVENAGKTGSADGAGGTAEPVTGA